MFLELDWRCPGCGHELADSPREVASETEAAVARLVDHHWSADIPGPFSQELVGTGAEAALSAIERIGKLVLAASDDLRLNGRRAVYAHGRVDLILENRPVAESRAVVEASVPILSDWPDAYHALLSGLLDRAPYDVKQHSWMRRLATEAGYLAMRPLHCWSGPVDYVERQRVAWTTGAFSSEAGKKHPQASRTVFTDIDDFATAAHSPRDAYVLPKVALSSLGGGANIE